MKNVELEFSFVNDKRKLYVCYLHAFRTEDGEAKLTTELKTGNKIWIDISAFTTDGSFK